MWLRRGGVAASLVQHKGTFKKNKEGKISVLPSLFFLFCTLFLV